MELRQVLRERPVIQAPMAGGVSTPGLAVAVAEAGGIGFLAGGYQTSEALAEQIQDVRNSGVTSFGVNVFVPGETNAALHGSTWYRDELSSEADRYGAEVGAPQDDDDGWDEKIAMLADIGVPVVSFTFGCPSADVLDVVKGSGSHTVVTVTTTGEALIAAERGADAVCAQGVEAGGHRGSFDPELFGEHPVDQLVADLVDTVDIPVIAAGGLMTGEHVARVLRLGAAAAQLGTAFLRCPESGAHPLHKAALADPSFTRTCLTNAFTGRMARALANRFTERHPQAPAAYPEVHHMTRAIRTAAARAGDPGAMALWAGQGFRQAKELPVSDIFDELRSEAAAVGVPL